LTTKKGINYLKIAISTPQSISNKSPPLFIKMDQFNLSPGDTVISLGALTITTTIIAGGINVAIIIWQFNQPWWLTVAGFLAVILVWALAKLTGLLLLFEKDA